MNNSFYDDLLRFKKRVSLEKERINNEEDTKNTLILPFMRMLGFNMSNFNDIRSEYDAYLGERKGKKADYAILINNIPIMLLEAKSVASVLSNHEAQLRGYFHAVDSVKIGIITNGLEYRFFSDIDTSNKMDLIPFFIFSFDAFTEMDANVLSLFRKNVFNEPTIRKKAEDLLSAIRTRKELLALLEEPSDDFIKLLVADFPKKIFMNKAALDNLRPIVKDTIGSVLSEIKSGKMDSVEDKMASMKMQAYSIVKTILQQAKKDVSDLDFKDGKPWFKVYKGKGTKIFVRFDFQKSAIKVGVFLPYQTVQQHIKKGFEIKQSDIKSTETIIKLNSLDEIQSLSKLIVLAYDNLVEPINNNDHSSNADVNKSGRKSKFIIEGGFQNVPLQDKQLEKPRTQFNSLAEEGGSGYLSTEEIAIAIEKSPLTIARWLRKARQWNWEFPEGCPGFPQPKKIGRKLFFEEKDITMIKKFEEWIVLGRKGNLAK